MGRKSFKEINREVKVDGDGLTWPDLQSMGALSILFTLPAFKQKKQPPKQPPKGNPGDEEDERKGKHKGPEEKGPSHKDIIQILSDPRYQKVETNTDWCNTPEMNTWDDEPGILVNAKSPDIMPMQYWRGKGNTTRRKEEEGAVPKFWHRFPIDRKVFIGTMKKGHASGRGSILVDLSGSMCWDENRIRDLLDVMPECTVYGYCGGGHITGRWAILADRNRAVHPRLIDAWRRRVGGDNLVDIPCLHYLSRLPGPRIWVSDCGVTGRRGGSRQLERYARQYCADNKIEIVGDTRGLRSYLKRRK